MNKFQKRRVAVSYVFLVIGISCLIAMDRAVSAIRNSIEFLADSDSLGGSSAEFGGALITLSFGGVIAGICFTLAVGFQIYSARD